VTAVDELGNAAIDYRGTVQFTSSDDRGMLPGAYRFMAVDQAVRTFRITFRTEGDQRITVTDSATPAITGNATVNVMRTRGPDGKE